MIISIFCEDHRQMNGIYRVLTSSGFVGNLYIVRRNNLIIHLTTYYTSVMYYNTTKPDVLIPFGTMLGINTNDYATILTEVYSIKGASGIYNFELHTADLEKIRYEIGATFPPQQYTVANFINSDFDDLSIYFDSYIKDASEIIGGSIDYLELSSANIYTNIRRGEVLLWPSIKAIIDVSTGTVEGPQLNKAMNAAYLLLLDHIETYFSDRKLV